VSGSAARRGRLVGRRRSDEAARGGLFGRAADGIALLAVLLLPAVLDSGQVQVAVNVGIFALLALGLNVVVGFAGLLDLGYAAFFAIGAYIYAFLASSQFGLHLPILAILPVGAIVAGIFGMSFGAPTLRLRGDYLAIVTLGFGEIVQLVANNWLSLTNGPQGIFGLDPASIFGWQLTTPTTVYYGLVAMNLLVVYATWTLASSRIGRSWEAIREDEDAARSVGISTVTLKLMAFCIGAMIAGLAGCLFAASQAFVSPVSFSLDQSILVLAMVILGGMGSIRGVIAGAAILTVLPELLRQYAEGRFIVVGLVMVAMMILRPEGLFPRRSRVRAAPAELPPVAADDEAAVLPGQRRAGVAP
jgi:branched-chain amino acid transport system permease protein